MTWMVDKLREVMSRIEPGRYQWKPSVDPIPVGREAMLEVYGDPNPSWSDERQCWIANPKWEMSHCKTVSASKIPGYDKRIYMHKLVAPHLIRAMELSVEACPDYEFRKIGCFNVRRMRHDTPEKARKENRKLLDWSDHYAAISFDINDKKNRGRYYSVGDPGPFEPGWNLFSDIPMGVVEAFTSVGFDWGGFWGLWYNQKTEKWEPIKGAFFDPMHFSLRWIRSGGVRRLSQLNLA